MFETKNADGTITVGGSIDRARVAELLKEADSDEQKAYFRGLLGDSEEGEQADAEADGRDLKAEAEKKAEEDRKQAEKDAEESLKAEKEDAERQQAAADRAASDASKAAAAKTAASKSGGK